VIDGYEKAADEPIRANLKKMPMNLERRPGRQREPISTVFILQASSSPRVLSNRGVPPVAPSPQVARDMCPSMSWLPLHLAPVPFRLWNEPNDAKAAHPCLFRSMSPGAVART